MARDFWVEPETQKYIRALKMIGGQALPEAIASSLNAPAAAIEKAARKNAQARLIIRTKFTINSIKQDRHARGLNVSKMFSRVGTSSTYLWKHDKGMVEKAERSRVPIPTLEARGGSESRRIVRRYYMNAVGNLDGAGGKFFIGKPANQPSLPVGIYERTNKNNKIKMIRNLSQTQVKIPATNFYSDAEKKYGTEQYIRAQFIKNAERIINSRLGGLK